MPHRTPLYDWHSKANAHLVDFAGWEMPMHYGSQIEEHHQVRQNAGIFDVSHMGILDIHGAKTCQYLRYVLANDVAKLQHNGDALYSCLLNEAGGVIDDLIVYRLDSHTYRLIVNASRREQDFHWLNEIAAEYHVELKPRYDLCMLAVQGPKSISLAMQVFNGAKQGIHDLQPFTSLSYQNFFIARTGYTGEDGVEIILPTTEAINIWNQFIQLGAQPCGLGARDTLRLEAGLNLYGSDMDENTSPLISNLAWTISWNDEKRNFVGKQALFKQKQEGITEKLVGIIMTEPGVLRTHQRIVFDSGEEGIITSGGFSPTLGHGIALARIPNNEYSTGKVERRGQWVEVKIIKPPFVKKATKIQNAIGVVE